MAIDLGRWKPELHPRDSKGRFRDKWGLSPKAMAAVDRLLANFNDTPALRSNAHAASYLRTQAPKRSDRQKEVLRKFLSREGNENIQSTLRAGDKPTADIAELDGMMTPLKHDLILSRVVGPDAFGLRAEDMDNVEDWSGQNLMDYGFSPMNIGDAYQVGGPHIEMRVLVPKGTPALIVGGDGNSADDARTVILPREIQQQNIKIQPDGRGGWYAMSVVGAQQGTGKPARAVAGRPLPARDKSPAIEATPDELERRGISPEAAGVPAPQEQPGRFGPATPSPGAGQQVLPQAPTAQSIPNPAATGPVAQGGPPGDVVQPAKAIKKAGGRAPVGSGQVVDEGTDLAPRKKLDTASGRGTVGDRETGAVDARKRAAAADKEIEARQKRLDAAQTVLEAREARAAQERAAAAEQLAKANDSQAKTIEQQQGLIDRLMGQGGVPLQPAAGGGSEGGTVPAGMSETAKDNVLRRVRPEGTTDEDVRQQKLAKAIRAERGLPEDGSADNVAPAKKTARAAPAAPKKAPAAAPAKAAPAAEEPQLSDDELRSAAAFKSEHEGELTPVERDELSTVATNDNLQTNYWGLRSSGSNHVKALQQTQELKSRTALKSAKAAPVKKAAVARPNHIGNQIRGEQFKDLRPGDVVEIPARNGRPAREATVDFVDQKNGTVHFTDDSKITPAGGAVKVVSQGNLKPSKAAQARAKRIADKAAAGLGTNEAIRGGRTGTATVGRTGKTIKVTPEQAAKNLDNKVADLRKLQVQLGDQAPPELPQVIDGLEKEAARLRGEGSTVSPAEAKKTASAVKRAAKKVAKERAEVGGESPLVAERPAAKKAARLAKKAAPAVEPVAGAPQIADLADPNMDLREPGVADIQAKLDKGESPAAVARLLRTRAARAERTANIDAGLEGNDTPEAKARLDRDRLKATRMREIADKLDGGAGVAKKAPAKAIKKAAPAKPTITRATPVSKMDDADIVAEAAKIEGAPETPRQRAVQRAADRINAREARAAKKAAPPAKVTKAAPAKKAAEAPAKKVAEAPAKKVAEAPAKKAPAKKVTEAAPAAKKVAAKKVAEKAAPAKVAAPAKAPAKAIKKATPEKPTITRRTAVSKMEESEVLAEAAKIEGTPQTPRERAVQRAADRINARQARAAKKAAPAVKATPAKKVAEKAAPAKVAKAAPVKAAKKATPAKAPAKTAADRAETEKIGAALHAQWQTTQPLLDDGTRKEKLKPTTDQKWIAAHGTDQVDIANTPFKDLPKDWQKENRDAGAVVQDILKRRGGKVDLRDKKTRLEVGDEIHKAWLSRENNSYAKGGKLDVPFADLPKVEQERDLDHVRIASKALAPAKASAPTKAAKVAKKAVPEKATKAAPAKAPAKAIKKVAPEKPTITRRAAKKAEPATVAKKAAPPEQAVKAGFGPGEERHIDLAKLADVDDMTVRGAQSDLNAGKSPTVVAARIRRAADSLDRNTTIDEKLSPNPDETPAARAQRFKQERKKVASLRKLADKLEATKRPSAAKKAAVKAVPEKKAAPAKTAAKAIKKAAPAKVVEAAEKPTITRKVTKKAAPVKATKVAKEAVEKPTITRKAAKKAAPEAAPAVSTDRESVGGVEVPKYDRTWTMSAADRRQAISNLSPEQVAKAKSQIEAGRAIPDEDKYAAYLKRRTPDELHAMMTVAGVRPKDMLQRSGNEKKDFIGQLVATRRHRAAKAAPPERSVRRIKPIEGEAPPAKKVAAAKKVAKVAPEKAAKAAPAKAPAKKVAAKAAPEKPTITRKATAKKAAPEAAPAKKVAAKAAPAKAPAKKVAAKKVAAEKKLPLLQYAEQTRADMNPTQERQVHGEKSGLSSSTVEEYYKRRQAGEPHLTALRHAQVAQGTINAERVAERAKINNESVAKLTDEQRATLAEFRDNHVNDLNSRQAAQVRRLTGGNDEVYWARRRAGADHVEAAKGLEAPPAAKKTAGIKKAAAAATPATPAKAAKAPAKAIKKAAPEKPTITRRPAVASMADEDVLTEAGKIEGAPSTPRERAISRKADVINARQERAAKKAAAPAKVAKAAPAKGIKKAAPAKAAEAVEKAAPEKPTITRKAAKKATPAAFDRADAMAKLHQDIPLSREDSHAMLQGAKREDLLAMAKELSVPGATSKSMPKLRSEIVEATSGRRADSIAIRGTTDIKPPQTPNEVLRRAEGAKPRVTRKAAAAEKAAPEAAKAVAAKAEPAKKVTAAKKAAGAPSLDEDEKKLLGPVLSQVTRAQRTQGIPDDKIVTNPAEAKAGMYVYSGGRFNKLVRPRNKPGKGWFVEDGNPQYLGSMPQAQVDSNVHGYNDMARQIEAARAKAPAKAIKKVTPEKATPAKEAVAKAVPGKATSVKAAPVAKRGAKKATATRGITEAEKKAPPAPVGTAKAAESTSTVRATDSWNAGDGLDTGLYLTLQQGLGKGNLKNLNTLDRETRISARHKNVPAAYQAARADLSGNPELQAKLDRWYKSTFKEAKGGDLTRPLMRRKAGVEGAAPRKVTPATPSADAAIRSRLTRLSPELRKEVLDSMTPEQRKAVEAAVGRADERLAARKVGKVAKAATPEVSAPAAAKAAKKGIKKAAPAAPVKAAKVAAKAAPEKPATKRVAKKVAEAAPEAPAKKAVRPLIKRQGKAVTSAQARKESALEAVRTHDMGRGDNETLGQYRVIERNLQSGDYTPAQAKGFARREAQKWRRDARGLDKNKQLSDKDRTSMRARMLTAGENYDKLADAIEASQTRDRIEAKRFGEAPTPAPSKRAVKAAAPEAPAKKVAAVKKAAPATKKATKAAPEAPAKKAAESASSETLRARKERADRRAAAEAAPETPAQKAARAAVEKETARVTKVTATRVAAERKADDKAHAEFMKPILKDAGVKESDLSDLEQTGLRMVATKLREGKISKATAARRLRTDRDSKLNNIADAIEGKPRKTAVKKAVKAAPEAPAKKAPAKAIKKAAPAKVAKAAPEKPTITRKAAKKAAPEAEAAAAKKATPSVAKKGARRVAPFDVNAVYKDGGEAGLRDRLSTLNEEQLKDVIAAGGMDNSRLSAKWKDRGRLTDLIVKRTGDRATKGQAFRTPPAEKVAKKAAPAAKKVAEKAAPEKPTITSRAEKRAATKAAKAATPKATAKKAPAKATAKLDRPAPEGADKKLLDSLTNDEIGQINELSPDSQDKYWQRRISRDISHDTAWRSVPKAGAEERIAELRKPSQPLREGEVRAPGTGGVDALRRPSAQFERPAPNNRRLTEDEKNAVLKQVRDARADNPNWPFTAQERELQREAEGIETARAATKKAAKAAPRSKVTGEEIKPKKITPAMAKARAIRAQRYDDAVPDLPGPEGNILRRAKEDLAAGDSATSVKQRLTKRAEYFRDTADIGRRTNADELEPGYVARMEAYAERYEKAADLAGKRIPSVKKAVKPGEKVAVKDLVDGDVAILKGKKGTFRQPSPRKTFIEFPDGTQEPVRKTALAQMVRDKDLQLLGGDHRANAPTGPEAPAAKKATKSIRPPRPVTVKRAADAPGNTRDKRRFEAADNKDTVKSRVDELVADGKTSPAAWKQALDEHAGPSAPAAPKATKKAAKVAKVAPEAPAEGVEKPKITRKGAKKVAAGEEKFLPPLADGTRRKSATNLKPGDKVRTLNSRNAPVREVESVEPEGRRLRVRFTDGTSTSNNPNTAHWMADEAPAERPLLRRRPKPSVETSNESPTQIARDLAAGRITRAEARERIRKVPKGRLKEERQAVRDAESRIDMTPTRPEKRATNKAERAARKADLKDRRERNAARGVDALTQAREEGINTRDSEIRRALEADGLDRGPAARRRLESSVTTSRQQANLLDYGTVDAPSGLSDDFVGGASARSRRLRRRAQERSRALEMLDRRGPQERSVRRVRGPGGDNVDTSLESRRARRPAKTVTPGGESNVVPFERPGKKAAAAAPEVEAPAAKKATRAAKKAAPEKPTVTRKAAVKKVAEAPAKKAAPAARVLPSERRRNERVAMLDKLIADNENNPDMKKGRVSGDTPPIERLRGLRDSIADGSSGDRELHDNLQSLVQHRRDNDPASTAGSRALKELKDLQDSGGTYTKPRKAAIKKAAPSAPEAPAAKKAATRVAKKAAPEASAPAAKKAVAAKKAAPEKPTVTRKPAKGSIVEWRTDDGKVTKGEIVTVPRKGVATVQWHNGRRETGVDVGADGLRVRNRRANEAITPHKAAPAKAIKKATPTKATPEVTPEPTKAAKAAAKKAAAGPSPRKALSDLRASERNAKYGPDGPSHIDIDKVRGDVDLPQDKPILDEAQAMLNDGQSPRAVAARLDQHAQSVLTHGVYLHGKHHSDERTGIAEIDDARKARAPKEEKELAKYQERNHKLRAVAEKLRGTRRPVARKAAAKAAPETPAPTKATKAVKKATPAANAVGTKSSPELRDMSVRRERLNSRISRYESKRGDNPPGSVEKRLIGERDSLNEQILTEEDRLNPDGLARTDGRDLYDLGRANGVNDKLTPAMVRDELRKKGVKAPAKKAAAKRLAKKATPESAPEKPVITRKATRATKKAIPEAAEKPTITRKAAAKKAVPETATETPAVKKAARSVKKAAAEVAPEQPVKKAAAKKAAKKAIPEKLPTSAAALVRLGQDHGILGADQLSDGELRRALEMKRADPNVIPISSELIPKEIRDASPEKLRAIGKAGGIDLEGDTPEELRADLIRKAIVQAARARLEGSKPSAKKTTRGAKKAAPEERSVRRVAPSGGPEAPTAAKKVAKKAAVAEPAPAKKATRAVKKATPEKAAPEKPTITRKATKAAKAVEAPAAATRPAAPSREGRVRDNGMIPLGKLVKGDRIMVTKKDDGTAIPSTRIGDTPITVDRVEVSQGRRGFQRTTNLKTVVGHDDNGNEIRVGHYPGHQTFRMERLEGGGRKTAAKKVATEAAKTSAPEKPVIKRAGAKKAAPALSPEAARAAAAEKQGNRRLRPNQRLQLEAMSPENREKYWNRRADGKDHADAIDGIPHFKRIGSRSGEMDTSGPQEVHDARMQRAIDGVERFSPRLTDRQKAQVKDLNNEDQIDYWGHRDGGDSHTAAMKKLPQREAPAKKATAAKKVAKKAAPEAEAPAAKKAAPAKVAKAAKAASAPEATAAPAKAAPRRTKFTPSQVALLRRVQAEGHLDDDVALTTQEKRDRNRLRMHGMLQMDSVKRGNKKVLRDSVTNDGRAELDKIDKPPAVKKAAVKKLAPEAPKKTAVAKKAEAPAAKKVAAPAKAAKATAVAKKATPEADRPERPVKVTRKAAKATPEATPAKAVKKATPAKAVPQKKTLEEELKEADVNLEGNLRRGHSGAVMKQRAEKAGDDPQKLRDEARRLRDNAGQLRNSAAFEEGRLAEGSDKDANLQSIAGKRAEADQAEKAAGVFARRADAIDGKAPAKKAPAAKKVAKAAEPAKAAKAVPAKSTATKAAPEAKATGPAERPKVSTTEGHARFDEAGNLTGSTHNGDGTHARLDQIVNPNDPNFPDDGIPVKDFQTHGEKVKKGRLTRHNGVLYLAEEGDGPGDKERRERTLKEVQAWHDTLPEGQKKYVKSIVSLSNPSSRDSDVARHRGLEKFESAASAGNGQIAIYKHGGAGHGSSRDTLDHELGHLIDQDGLNAHRFGSKSEAWRDAGRSDNNGLRDRAPGFNGFNRLSAEDDDTGGRGTYRFGITKYGTSDPGEDFAESYAGYRRGWLGNIDDPDNPGRRRKVHFRELYPARAAIFDRMFPEQAQKQRKEIAEYMKQDPEIRELRDLHDNEVWSRLNPMDMTQLRSVAKKVGDGKSKYGNTREGLIRHITEGTASEPQRRLSSPQLQDLRKMSREDAQKRLDSFYSSDMHRGLMHEIGVESPGRRRTRAEMTKAILDKLHPEPGSSPSTPVKKVAKATPTKATPAAGRPTITRKATKAAAPEAPAKAAKAAAPAKKAAPAKAAKATPTKAAPEKPVVTRKATAAKKATPEATPAKVTKAAPAKKAATKAAKAAAPAAAPTPATTAKDRLVARQKEARIRKAQGSVDLANNLLHASEAFRRGDNPDGFMRAARQDVTGATPGDLGNPRDTHAAGWEDLKKALGPEKNWNTPDKLESRLRNVLGRMGISVDHTHGEMVKFDPDGMDAFDGTHIDPGDEVRIVHPGLSYKDKDGTVHVLRRPTVTRRRGGDTDTGPLAPDGGPTPPERSVVRTVQRSRIPAAPDTRSRPDTRDVTPTVLTGRQGMDTSDMGPAGDIGSEGLPVKDYTLRSGYHVQHGTLFKQDRIPYLIEHEDTPEGKAHAKEIQKALAIHRQSLPLSKRRLQRSYGWVGGHNPKDADFAARHGVDPDDWLSEATSDSLGGVTVYNRDEFGPAGVTGSLDHEFAHSLDHLGSEEGLAGSDSKAWRDASVSDDAHRKGLRDLSFYASSVGDSPVRLEKDEGSSGPDHFPYGVTDYGTAHAAEDYAEAFRLYRAGVIAKGRRTPGGPIEPLWFRDLFPARAAVLDKAVPDFAEKQLGQIGEARSQKLSTAQRGELIKRLLTERRNQERNVAFRKLAETAPTRARMRAPARSEKRVVSGTVPLGQDIRSAFDGDIGPEGVEIGGSEGLHLARHDYTIKNGRAWRDGNDLYIVEGKNGPQMRRQLEALRAERARLPKELGDHSRTFVVVDGHSPSTLRRMRESNAPPGMGPFASAGDGTVTFWGRRESGLLGQDGQFAPTLRHEASHNSDTAFDTPSLSPEWLDAAQAGAKGSQVRSFKQHQVPGQGPLRFRQPPARGRMYPDGVTPYGLSNGREDWAEASEFYFGTDANNGIVGTGTMEGILGTVPIWFRDLFPERAAILDRYYPEFAAQQLAEIRRRRG